MSVNSSSSNASSINYYDLLQSCLNSTVGTFNITAFTIISILLLLPLYILVIYLGLQRWRSGTTMSHSDLFTYHMVAIELISVVGSILTCCGILTDLREMITLSMFLFIINTSGQQFFHILTCVERYLAVVHPVTYRGLREAKGIRIRNITIGCAWLLCFLNVGLYFVKDINSVKIFYFCLLAFMLIVVSFCSLSVLCVLIRPGPGEGGGDRQRVDQSKLRAFSTMMAILGVLLFRFGGTVVSTAVYDLPQLEETESCNWWLSLMWFSLPSSLVLPLLFLHRAGKLPCCRNNNESGQESD